MEKEEKGYNDFRLGNLKQMIKYKGDKVGLGGQHFAMIWSIETIECELMLLKDEVAQLRQKLDDLSC